ncbi:hypothetical protein D3C85_867000 [compost metagenome]
MEHSRLREYFFSLNNDLQRYADIFQAEIEDPQEQLDIFKCLSAEEKVIAAKDALIYGLAHRMEQIKFPEDAVHWKVSAD